MAEADKPDGLSGDVAEPSPLDQANESIARLRAELAAAAGRATQPGPGNSRGKLARIEPEPERFKVDREALKRPADSSGTRRGYQHQKELAAALEAGRPLDWGEASRPSVAEQLSWSNPIRVAVSRPRRRSISAGRHAEVRDVSPESQYLGVMLIYSREL